MCLIITQFGVNFKGIVKKTFMINCVWHNYHNNRLEVNTISICKIRSNVYGGPQDWLNAFLRNNLKWEKIIESFAIFLSQKLSFGVRLFLLTWKLWATVNVALCKLFNRNRNYNYGIRIHRERKYNQTFFNINYLLMITMSL